MAARARELWHGLAVFVATFAAIGVAAQFAGSPWQSGFLTGAIVTAAVGSIAVGLVWSSESAYARWSGAGAEGFTAEKLERPWRRYLGWRSFHGLQIGGHDIDHVAVGPGGLFAIETKWAGGEPCRVRDGRLVGMRCDPIGQAQRSAAKVRSFLRSVDDGPAYAVDVRAVLVVWGPGAPELGIEPVVIDGVLVMSGGVNGHWYHMFRAGTLDRDVSTALADKLEHFADRQWRELREAV